MLYQAEPRPDSPFIVRACSVPGSWFRVPGSVPRRKRFHNLLAADLDIPVGGLAVRLKPDTQLTDAEGRRAMRPVDPSARQPYVVQRSLTGARRAVCDTTDAIAATKIVGMCRDERGSGGW